MPSKPNDIYQTEPSVKRPQNDKPPRPKGTLCAAPATWLCARCSPQSQPSVLCLWSSPHFDELVVTRAAVEPAQLGDGGAIHRRLFRQLYCSARLQDTLFAFHSWAQGLRPHKRRSSLHQISYTGSEARVPDEGLVLASLHRLFVFCSLLSWLLLAARPLRPPLKLAQRIA